MAASNLYDNPTGVIVRHDEKCGILEYSDGTQFKLNKLLKPATSVHSVVVTKSLTTENSVAAIVVTKCIRYGVHLVVYDTRIHQLCVKDKYKNDFTIIQLTTNAGIQKNYLANYISRIKACFSCQSIWTRLCEEFKDTAHIDSAESVPINTCEFDLKLNVGKDLFESKFIQFLKIGDVIGVKRKNFDHYGVYVGDGQIAHVWDPDDSNGKKIHLKNLHIHITSFDDFKVDSHLFHVSYTLLPVKCAKDVIAQTRSDAEREHLKGKYNVLTENCEHYARGVGQANHNSIQVKHTAKDTTKIGAAGIASYLSASLLGAFFLATGISQMSLVASGLVFGLEHIVEMYMRKEKRNKIIGFKK